MSDLTVWPFGNPGNGDPNYSAAAVYPIISPFVNVSAYAQVSAALSALVVIGINVFLAVNYLTSNLDAIGAAMLAAAATATASYVLFCTYLALDMAAHMGLPCSLG